jgi:hypothetical protein
MFVNKAFVREPDSDARLLCPRCAAPGTAVGNGPVQTYVPPELRSQLLDAAWYCSSQSCEVAYFNMFEQFVRVTELLMPVYPHDLNAPLCACFGFTVDDIEADVLDGQPLRIRALLARSQSPEARCQTLAADGQCCMREIQRIYMKLRSGS